MKISRVFLIPEVLFVTERMGGNCDGGPDRLSAYCHQSDGTGQESRSCEYLNSQARSIGEILEPLPHSKIGKGPGGHVGNQYPFHEIF